MAVNITNYNFGQMINFICTLVGYQTSQDPAGSQDPKHAQMRAAVTEACAEMLAINEWQDLTQEGSITIVADAPGQKEKGFALPVDFYRFIDQTQWADDQLWPAGGPVSPQAWKRFIVWATYPQMTLYWQIRNDKLWVLSPPEAPTPFTFFYISKAQIIDADNSALLKNHVEKNGDTFVLDAYVIALLARKKWLEWNNMDSGAATNDFNVVFNSRAGGDKGAPILSIARVMELPLIHPMTNTPNTGYGGV